jgi:transposase
MLRSLRNLCPEERRLYRVHLTEEQRAELQRRTRMPGLMPRTRDRLEMVRLSDAGWSIPKVARHLRLDEQRVRYWIKRFLAGSFAALPDQPHRGQPSRLTPEILTALKAELAKGNRTWTAQQLADWLADHHGIEIGADWLGRKLRRARVSYKRTRTGLKHQRNPAEVEVKEAELHALEKGARPVVWTSGISIRLGSRLPCQ